MSNLFLFSMDDIESKISCSGQYSSSCNVGTVAEASVALKAMTLGFVVFLPFGHSQKADLILWKPPDRPLSIQVKKASYQKTGSFKFMVGSGKPSCAANSNDYGLRHTPYSKGDFDFLCAFIQERNEFVFYSLNELVGKSCQHWRPGTTDRVNNWEILTSTNLT